MTASGGETASETSRGLYHPELDGLRFFAFLAVFFHHALPDDQATWRAWGAGEGLASWLSTLVLTGSLGVDFFLCLSAYLITTLLLRERETHAAIDYKAFLARRALRIWPLYYAFLAFVFFVWPLIVPSERVSPRQLFAFATFFSNWECAFFGYPTSILAPLWSIALEEQFYVAWPLLLRLGTRRLVRALFFVWLIAAAARLVLFRADFGSQMLWCNTLTRLDPIVLGALLAILSKREAPRLRASVRRAITCAALVVIVITARVVPLHRDPVTIGVVPSFAVMGIACAAILWANLLPMGERSPLLSNRLIVWFGRLSYGLYVFHMLGLRIARRAVEAFSPSGAASAVTVLLGLACTVAIAALSNRFLERPFLEWKRYFTPVSSTPASNDVLVDPIFQERETNRA